MKNKENNIATLLNVDSRVTGGDIREIVNPHDVVRVSYAVFESFFII